MGLDLTDYTGASDFWTNCWHNVKSNNNKIQTTFTFNIDKDIHYENMDYIGFIFAINSSTKDDEILFTDIKFVFLDETKNYNITLHYGNLSKTIIGYSECDNNLPSNSNQIENFGWCFEEQEFLGWYDNESYSGTQVSTIPAENTTDKEFWMKYNLKTCRRDWDDNGTPNHLWDSEIPLAAVIPDFDVSKLIQGTTIKINVTATPSVSSFNKYFLRLVDCSNEGWKDIAWTEENADLVDNKISYTFSLNVHTDASTSELKDILFGIGYNKETYDESITLSDWNFEVVEDGRDEDKYSVTASYSDGKDGASWVGIYDYEETVTLSVTASAREGNIAYQWYSYEYSEKPSDAKEISGATSSSYTVPNDGELDKFFYCKATLLR